MTNLQKTALTICAVLFAAFIIVKCAPTPNQRTSVVQEAATPPTAAKSPLQPVPPPGRAAPSAKDYATVYANYVQLRRLFSTFVTSTFRPSCVNRGGFVKVAIAATGKAFPAEIYCKNGAHITVTHAE